MSQYVSNPQLEKLGRYVGEALERGDGYMEHLQTMLNFDTNTPLIASNPHYNSNTGLGRVGLIGFLLGIAFGLHAMLWCVIVVLGLTSSFSTALVSSLLVPL